MLCAVTAADFVGISGDFMKYTKEQLDLMLHSKHWPDRWAVARQGYGLDVLVHDEEAIVRVAVAEQGYGLDILAHDDEAKVRDVARLMAEKQKSCVDDLIADAERSAAARTTDGCASREEHELIK